MTPTDINGNTNSVSPTSVSNTGVAQGNVGRVLPRQISPGNIRGNMNIVGSLNIISPSSNVQTISLSGTDETLIFTDPTNSLRRIIIGILPDGTFNIAISKPGKDVITDGFS